MVNLDYDPTSFAGPVDNRVVDFLAGYRHKLDPSYLLHAAQFHGGVPGKQYFDGDDGKTYRIGRFLTLVDRDSELTAPFKQSWQFPERDIRIDWSVLTLIDEEGPSCRQLFHELLPFAALYRGKHHPDDMSLREADCDLVCFRYESKKGRPRVVIWLAHESAAEYHRWEKAGCDQVQYGYFTVAAAADFDKFLQMLRDHP